VTATHRLSLFPPHPLSHQHASLTSSTSHLHLCLHNPGTYSYTISQPPSPHFKMCHRLLQVYACNHSKTICTTPCPHALNTGRIVSLTTTTNTATISRSNSTVSSITPSRQLAPSSPTFRLVTPSQPSPPSYPRPSSFPDTSATIEPNLCPYHFPRPLPQSNHPCLDCYMEPAWAHLATCWMRQYREDHVMEKMEDVERWSGITELRAREKRG
jgi:hypothetical protein